ncbi:MAG: Wzz/FepE/Etk N-terminal domain-containing protein, partial [Planctomycetota bacterium]
MPDKPRRVRSMPSTGSYGPSLGSSGEEIPGLAPPSFSGGLDWPRYFAAVLRYRWLVAALTAIGTFAGILASSLIPTEYQARATVAVDTAGEAALVSGPIRASALLEP